MILEILVNMGKNWVNAGNKLISKRYCIRATMIIVGAFIVAHFLDKSFYTIKRSSSTADKAAAVFAFVMRGFLFILSILSFYKIWQAVKLEPFLRIKQRMAWLHAVILGGNFFFIALYELSLLIWATGGTNKELEELSSSRLFFLSFCELFYNISCVFSVILLGHMMDIMTDNVIDQDRLIEPISHKAVPFFVYLASIKLLNEHLEQQGRRTTEKSRSGSESSRSESVCQNQ